MNISEALINWYLEHKRNLPWRQTTNPYFIWLSEIILQQTRVQQGLPYYQSFTTKYPTIQDLANATEDDVLKTWQGLGYYSRARNLHATAKIIVAEHQSIFPDSYSEVIKLKGIGPYTAAAICSFSYKQPYAVLDGNVFRVLSRLFIIDTPINSSPAKAVFEPLAKQCLSIIQPDIYNQAIMELGAMVCTPTSPLCHECPIQANCLAYSKGIQENLPVKIKAKKAKVRHFNYLVFQHQEQTLLTKRTDQDIWQGLFQFPLIETTEQPNTQEIVDLIKQKHPEIDIAQLECKALPKHILSHQHIYSYFWTITLNEATNISNDWISNENVKSYPVSKNIERFLNFNSVFL